MFSIQEIKELDKSHSFEVAISVSKIGGQAAGDIEVSSGRFVELRNRIQIVTI